MGATDTRHDEDSETLLRNEEMLKPPSFYKVLLHNDDYTPMDFVVKILQQFFDKPFRQAREIMLKVHHEGKGLCGLFTREIAETKVHRVVHYSRQHGHPLKCTMEKDS